MWANIPSELNKGSGGVTHTLPLKNVANWVAVERKSTERSNFKSVYEWIYVKLNHFALQLKLIQHCKSYVYHSN